MNKKKIIDIFIVIIAVILIGVGGYLAMNKKSSQITPILIQTQSTLPEKAIEYTNNQYGFSFSLPVSWKGYSIVNENWEGNMINVQNGQSIKGPEILIRHPLWTSAIPRQDIPIMIFTLSQWDLVQQEKLSLGAAPIPPSELGSNTNYIFALPARYNFAFPVGFEEVQTIMDSKPLSAF